MFVTVESDAEWLFATFEFPVTKGTPAQIKQTCKVLERKDKLHWTPIREDAWGVEV